MGLMRFTQRQQFENFGALAVLSCLWIRSIDLSSGARHSKAISSRCICVGLDAPLYSLSLHLIC